jgi:hypothetical protein
MLQISTGRFFGDGKVNCKQCQAVLYSNLSWPGPIETSVGDLQPCNDASQGLSTWVLSYPLRYEEVEVSGPAKLIYPPPEENAEQYRLVAQLWFGTTFGHDRLQVETLCRRESRNGREEGPPHSVVTRAFDLNATTTQDQVDGFARFLEKVVSIPRKSYRRLIGCLSIYSDALEAIDTNRSLAYSMFVYALEALAESAKRPNASWEDLPSELREAIELALAGCDPQQRAKATEAIVASQPHLRLKRRLLDFVQAHLADSFFDLEAVEKTPTLRPSEVERAVTVLYESRSRFVHSLQKIGENLRLAMWGPHSDVLHWEGNPCLTLSGLVRLSRHEFLQYVEKQPASDRENYPEWRDELPGSVPCYWSPVLWATKSKNYQRSNATQYFNALLSHWTKQLQTAEDRKQLLDQREILQKIREHIPKSDPDLKSTLLNHLFLFQSLMPVEDRDQDDEKLLNDFSLDLGACTAAAAAVQVLLYGSISWPASEASGILQEYGLRKHRKTSVRMPARLEIALQAAIGNKWLAEDEPTKATATFRQCRLEAAGMPLIQELLEGAANNATKVSTEAILRMREIDRQGGIERADLATVGDG